MKKAVSIFIIFMMLFSTASCSFNNKNVSSKKIKIVATIFPFYDFAKNIVGDKADVELLVKPGKSSHDYKTTMSLNDMTLSATSDLFIYCGGETDSFILESEVFKDRDKSKNISAMSLVKTYNEEHVEGMQEEHHEDEHDHALEIDEHIWTNPQNAVLICKNITEKLKNIDSDNAEYYEKNNNEYIKKLINIDKEFEKIINNSRQRTIIVADRFPFRYLTERYKINYYAAFPGCSSSSEPSLETITFLINKVKELNSTVVFYTDGSTRKLSEKIANETNTKQLLLHSCHDITKEEFDNGENYLSLMNKNLMNLAEALN